VIYQLRLRGFRASDPALTPSITRTPACCPKVIGLDVWEIAPAFDGGQTASLGAKLIREFIAAKAAAKR